MTILETEGRSRDAYFTATELLDRHFPEPRWAIPGLIPEGLTLLAGAPKLGKSWLCLGLGLAVAAGRPALGKIPVDQGAVLYAALEDPPRRLKSRLQKVLVNDAAPDNLTLITQLPTLTIAADMIAEWLEERPDARLVIIDVLAKIRPHVSTQTNAYEADYNTLSMLKRLADQYKIAIVVVTHLRKMPAGDVFDEISGSTGLTGAADTSIVAKRTRGENAAALHITGRDVLENEYAVTFDAERCAWTLDGDALAESAQKAKTLHAVDGLGDQSAEIVALLAKYPDGMGPNAIADEINMDRHQIRAYLGRLTDSGRIRKIARGLYGPVASVASVAFGTENVLDFQEQKQHKQRKQHPVATDGEDA